MTAPESWVVQTAIRPVMIPGMAPSTPEWVTRSSYGSLRAAMAERKQLGPRWRRQGLAVRVTTGLSDD